MERAPSLQISDEDIVYACRVLDCFAEAFDRVAAQPELGPQLAVELAQKSADIFDALLAVTHQDCRPVVYDLGKSVLNAVKACLKKPKKK